MTDLTLNDGRTMPALGMGTYQIPEPHAAQVVRAGIDAGYRLVDTATIYGNEAGVGTGLAATDTFVTTKLWNDRHEDAAAALDESLALLGRDSVDLYLIHWPVPRRDAFTAAWRSLIDLREAGKVGSIGVSNFQREHVKAIVAATGVTPAVNQIELHPYFQQRALAGWLSDQGVIVQSWSPIGQGGALLSDPALRGIADRLGVSVARVVIAWHLAKGYSAIPKASGAEHLADNLAAAELALSAEDVAAIDALDRADGRTGPDPLTFG